jgi:hypothetical protein
MRRCTRAALEERDVASAGLPLGEPRRGEQMTVVDVIDLALVMGSLGSPADRRHRRIIAATAS